MTFFRKTKYEGFSLAEMLLTMGLLVGLTGLSITIYMGFIDQNKLDSVRSSVAQALITAQTNSAAPLADSQWGVHLTSTSITLFAGNSYVSRNTAHDYVYTFPTAIDVSGPTDITFSKVYGVPSTSGVINLSLSGKTMSITINSKEIVSF